MKINVKALLLGVLATSAIESTTTEAARMRTRARRDMELSALTNRNNNNNKRAAGGSQMTLSAAEPAPSVLETVVSVDPAKDSPSAVKAKIVKAKVAAVAKDLKATVDSDDEDDVADPHDKTGKQQGPIVTKDFCWSVLEGVQERVPPYFDPSTGTYTPECRDRLVKDCGQIVCGWSTTYKTLVETCSGNPFLCPTAPCHGFGLDKFFSNINSVNYPQLAATLLSHRQVLAVAATPSGPQNLVALNGAEAGGVAVVAPRFAAAQSKPTPTEKKVEKALSAVSKAIEKADADGAKLPKTSTDDDDDDDDNDADDDADTDEQKERAAKAVVQAAKKVAGAATKKTPFKRVAPASSDLVVHTGLPIQGLEPAVVTDKFCKSVLENVAKKAAPYYVEGHINVELRQDLYQQCGSKICNWGLKLAATYKDICKEDCMCPENCNMTSPYIDGLVQAGLIGKYADNLIEYNVLTGGNRVVPHPTALGGVDGLLGGSNDMIAIPHAPSTLNDPSTSKVTVLRGGALTPEGMVLPKATEITIKHGDNLTRVKPTVTSVKQALRDIPANDPRDPTFNPSSK